MLSLSDPSNRWSFLAGDGQLSNTNAGCLEDDDASMLQGFLHVGQVFEQKTYLGLGLPWRGAAEQNERGTGRMTEGKESSEISIR